MAWNDRAASALVDFRTVPHDISALRMMVGIAALSWLCAVLVRCSKPFVQVDELDDEREEGCQRWLYVVFRAV